MTPTVSLGARHLRHQAADKEIPRLRTTVRAKASRLHHIRRGSDRSCRSLSLHVFILSFLVHLHRIIVFYVRILPRIRARRSMNDYSDADVFTLLIAFLHLSPRLPLRPFARAVPLCRVHSLVLYSVVFVSAVSVLSSALVPVFVVITYATLLQNCMQ